MKSQHAGRLRVCATAIAASAAAALLLAGCGGGGGGESSGSSKTAAAPAARAPVAHAQAGGASSLAGPGGARSRRAVPLSAGSDIIYTASLTVRARDVARADAAAQQIVTDVGGYVSSETTSIDPSHPARSTASLELKIPVSAYPATLDKLGAELGSRVSLHQQAQDVTETVADTRSRVLSAEAAIAQLRTLLHRATSIADLLNIQEQISEQESSLESLQAQQRALDHETTYATVSLQVIGYPAQPVKPKRHDHPAGFIGGLKAGWRALRGFGNGLLMVLGAVTPFAALIAIAAYLAYRYRRRLFGHRTPPAAAE